MELDRDGSAYFLEKNVLIGSITRPTRYGLNMKKQKQILIECVFASSLSLSYKSRCNNYVENYHLDFWIIDFFFVLPSGTFAQAQNDFPQPESGVEIGNEFSEISDLVSHSLEKKEKWKISCCK